MSEQCKAPDVEALRSRLVLQANAALSMPIPMTGIAEITRQAEQMIAWQKAELEKRESALSAARAEGYAKALKDAAQQFTKDETYTGCVVLHRLEKLRGKSDV